MNHLKRITNAILPLQKQLVTHPMYDSMKSIADVRVFMENQFLPSGISWSTEIPAKIVDMYGDGVVARGQSAAFGGLRRCSVGPTPLDA